MKLTKKTTVFKAETAKDNSHILVSSWEGNLGFEVNSVRGAFPAGKDLFYTELLNDTSHIQFTLREGYFSLIEDIEIIEKILFLLDLHLRAVITGTSNSRK